jgi:S1-C subfamily serine protease/uncharacterized membrane protein YfcA
MQARVSALLIVLACLAGSLPGPSWGAAPTGLPELQEAISRAVSVNKASVTSVKARKKTGVQGGGEIWYESIGSGVVVDERGYILTNSHVIRGSQSILVGFWEQGVKDVKADLVDEDPSSDLALLRVDPPVELRRAVFADSNKIAQGDWVVALGCPLGFEYSASFGVVSALKRDLRIEGTAYRGMLQTDAHISQGNSGGPLLDLDGEVAGITVAIYSPDNAYTGVGFVIPSNKAARFVSNTTGVVSKFAAGRAATAQVLAAAKPVVMQPLPGQAVAGQPDNAGQTPGNIPQGWEPLPAPKAEAEGAVQAAAATTGQVAAPAKLLPLDINKKMPGDATHKGYPSCTDCHEIVKKSIVNINKPIPHPALGSCATCHDIIQEKLATGPVTVAWDNVVAKVPAASMLKPADALVCLFLFVAALASLVLRLDAGLLGVPMLLLMGYDTGTAVAAGLTLTAACGLVGVLRSGVGGMVDGGLIVAVVPVAAVAAFVGGYLFRFVQPDLIALALIGTFMLAALMQLGDIALAPALAGKPPRSGRAWRKVVDGQEYAAGYGLCMTLVIPSALAGGLLGCGGVWFFLPIFVSIFKTPLAMAEAAGAVLSVTVGAFGLLGHIVSADADLSLTKAIACATLIGALLGLVGGAFRHSRPARVCGFVMLVLAAAGMTMRSLGYI